MCLTAGVNTNRMYKIRQLKSVAFEWPIHPGMYGVVFIHTLMIKDIHLSSTDLNVSTLYKNKTMRFNSQPY